MQDFFDALGPGFRRGDSSTFDLQVPGELYSSFPGGSVSFTVSPILGLLRGASLQDGALDWRPCGYFLEATERGHRTLVGLYQGEGTEQLHALAWMMQRQPPVAPEPPRRGLLWHLVSAARTWFEEGFGVTCFTSVLTLTVSTPGGESDAMAHQLDDEE